MRKVLFYTETKWAFGAIHYGLSRELYKHGIIADVLSWDQGLLNQKLEYTLEEFKLLASTYDIFLTTPPFVLKLHKDYGVPLNKIITMAHEQWDLYLANEHFGVGFFEEVKDFAVISNILIDTSKKLGINRTPKVVNCGICFDNFYMPISKSLKNIGYGGAKFTPNFFGIDRKRGYLVEEALAGIENVQLITHNYYHYLCMAGYYQSLDCLVVSSLEESGGMPAMEAAAAGRLVISTPLGYFEEHGPKGGGIVAPLENEKFVQKVKETILFYRDNPTIHKIKCEQIQQYAREHYDWSKKIGPWLELLG